MTIKQATKWALIGAIIGALMPFCYLLLNSGIMGWSPAISIVTNILSIFTSCTLALFLYVLYKNQK